MRMINLYINERRVADVTISISGRIRIGGDSTFTNDPLSDSGSEDMIFEFAGVTFIEQVVCDSRKACYRAEGA